MSGVKVTFVERAEVKDHLGLLTDEFEAGETYSMSEASAHRWVRRGKAIPTAEHRQRERKAAATQTAAEAKAKAEAEAKAKAAEGGAS